DARPYAPSWVDLIMVWMTRAPGPTWLAYLVMLALAFVVALVEGLAATKATLDPSQLFFGFFFVTPLAVLHYLDHSAGKAWDGFRPVTNLNAEAAARVRYQLTVSPARNGLVALLLGYAINTLWFAADPAGVGIAGQPVLHVALRVVIEGYLAGVLFMLLYQTIRQLLTIDRLHDAATNIDLFRPRAVHAMSGLTARSAIGIVFLAVATGLPVPGGSEQSWLVSVFGFSVPMLILALIAFFVPLRGLHDRLVEEKARLQAATATRLRQTIDALHQLVDSEAANTDDVEKSRQAQTRIDALSKAQTALVQERDFIARLSIWPWDPSTLRAVVSAIALPIGLFLITRVLDRFV
ncbi:MAG: hypothetical protein QFC55_08160, partial [Chloroflexota bacterium]|nr:hypothetical protein [Chloroflexota bacterium]